MIETYLFLGKHAALLTARRPSLDARFEHWCASHGYAIRHVDNAGPCLVVERRRAEYFVLVWAHCFDFMLWLDDGGSRKEVIERAVVAVIGELIDPKAV